MTNRRPPIRILTAVPICDGHDSTINTINLELIRHGVEVIYLGYHRSARDIVRAAIQEDVRGIGISSYNGGHVEFFSEVVDLLRKRGAGDIGVFGGGGGTITIEDAKVMRRHGVDRIFFAGTPLDEMTRFVIDRYGRSRPARPAPHSVDADLKLSRVLTNRSKLERSADVAEAYVIGITGPGGAGKTTLIDELILRFLNSRSKGHVAILSHDPSIIGNGALLGDRAAMINSQHDRVFMRSLATRGRAGGLSPQTERSLRLLKSHGGFNWIILETVGTGQEAVPFGESLVDRSILVMSPDYGSRLQLQKIVMLDAADIVVVNKSDLPGAKTASAEIEQRLTANHRGQMLFATVSKRHRDRAVDALFDELGGRP